MSPAKATRPGFRQSLAASFTESDKIDVPSVNLFHPIYHSYTYPLGCRIDVERNWPVHLKDEDVEDLIDAFSEPPQFIERLSPVSVQFGDEIIKGNNWTELMVRVYRRAFNLFGGIGSFIETTLKQGQNGTAKVPFVSLAVDPDTLHRIIELDYESGEATYTQLMNQYAEGTIAPCVTTPFHAILPLLSDAEIRLCARISFTFYHRILKKYQDFLKKQGEEGLAVVSFWIPESAFHSKVEAVIREEFQAFCKKARLGKPHLVFLLDSHQAPSEQNDVLMKTWNLIEKKNGTNGRSGTNGKNGKTGGRKSKKTSDVHPAVSESSVVFRDRSFSDWVVYANPSVKKLLDRTIAKVDSNLNRQDIHYGWAHFESLESMAFSPKSVSNFKQKLVKLTELGYVPLSPDIYVRGKLRGQLGYADQEPRKVEIRDNSTGTDWKEDSEVFSRWQGFESVDGNGTHKVAEPRTFARFTQDGTVEEDGAQCWKLAWTRARTRCTQEVVGDLETCKGGMAEVLAGFVGGRKADVRIRNVQNFLAEYTYVYWREHFIQHELSEADIDIHEIANRTLRAGLKQTLTEEDAAICSAAAQAIFFCLESSRSAGTSSENFDQRAFYQNVVMLTLALCNATYVHTWLKDAKKARETVGLIQEELIDFEGAYSRHSLKKFGVTRVAWEDAIRSNVADSKDNIVKRAALRVAASHLRPLGFTREFSRDDELITTSVGHLWKTEIENTNFKYENQLFCGVSEA